MKKLRQAVILCGGLGTRLHPITLDIPKPLVKVGHKPMLEIILSKLASNGFSEAVLLTGYKSEMIERHFGDGSDYGLAIEYSVEGKPLGSAGALLQARDILDGDFLVCNCDTIIRYDFAKLYERHFHHKSLATVLLGEVRDVERFGIAEVGSGGSILRFLEKPRPSQTKSRLANTGIYALNKDALAYARADSFSMEREIFPPLCSDGRLFGVRLASGEEWLDIGTLGELNRVNSEISAGRHKWLFG